MTIPEQMWFAIAISGFVLLWEGFVTEIYRILRIRYPQITVSEQLSKVIGGLVLFVIAIVYLINLPR
jgi:hypothetical protein